MSKITWYVLLVFLPLASVNAKEPRKSQQRYDSPRVTVVMPTSVDPAVALAAEDVARYFRTVCRATRASTVTEDKLLENARGDHLVLVGSSSANNPHYLALLGEVLAKVKATPRTPSPEGYSLRIVSNPFARERVVMLVEAQDKMGLQYGSYDLVKRVLGVRYLSPYFEHVPRKDSLALPPLDVDESPQLSWRGVECWAYHYNGRGSGNGGGAWGDVLDRFRERNVDWFKRYADWLIKNRVNYVLYFGDLWCWDPMSQQLPQQVRQYNVMRGLKLLTGLGWPANEGRPRGDKWETDYLLCVDQGGKVIGEPYYQHPCQAAPGYWELARTNLNKIDFSCEQTIGMAIAYGETGRANSGVCGCVRCANIPGDQGFRKDLDFVREYLEKKGRKIPVGFFEQSWGGPGSKVAEKLIAQMSDDDILVLYPYRFDSWRKFSHWYEAIRRKNASGSCFKIFQGCELYFLCATDIPLWRPSTMELRAEHFRTLPREDLAGSFVSHSLTQWLAWLSLDQVFAWQWRYDPTRNWREDAQHVLTAVFGQECGRLTAQIMDKLSCLEYQQPYEPWTMRKGSFGGDPWQHASLGFAYPSASVGDSDTLAVINTKWARHSALLELASSIEKDLKEARKTAADSQMLFDREVADVLEWTMEFMRMKLLVEQAHTAAMRAKRSAAHTPPNVDAAINDLRLAAQLAGEALKARRRYFALCPAAEKNQDGDWIRLPGEKEVISLQAKCRELARSRDTAAIAAYTRQDN